MKKIFLGLAFGLGVLTSAQQYPNNGWGDDGYYQNDGGYYGNEDDRNNFPDDYYYNYPQDYYPGDYYQNYYNDYRNSIVNINWNGFFVQNRLSRWQIDQILRLNNLYASFTAWDNFYRYNPDRWYYDRFYALERILGPRVFVVFRNDYYRGMNPVVYFQNYRRTYYVPRYAVMPRYRNVNINIYRVDRSRFRRMDNPTFDIIRRDDRANNNGFRGPVRDGSNNSGGFRNDNVGGRENSNNGGFRGDSGNNGSFRGNADNNNGGFRGNSDVRRDAPKRQDNGGFRGNEGGGFRGNNEARREAPKRQNNGGFRGNDGGGFRGRSENSAPRQENHGNGGFRGSLVRN
ncbi:hypothetical protein C1631_022215 [Chryseobacterium phosphatilyticum]|uniref:Uncharacterized protein n=1 Tax=Chryseobacterium phosphatilyticum TaxID=475075 RepID=A0A316WNX9_9FLAO|nr:hypothetical protein [Chryseobacterium phosphatilyticum]PWN63005.1 hypothetical protein C1631_022215 [Chryseobacterium phosphatilyticum]